MMSVLFVRNWCRKVPFTVLATLREHTSWFTPCKTDGQFDPPDGLVWHELTCCCISLPALSFKGQSITKCVGSSQLKHGLGCFGCGCGCSWLTGRSYCSCRCGCARKLSDRVTPYLRRYCCTVNRSASTVGGGSTYRSCAYVKARFRFSSKFPTPSMEICIIS